MKVKVFFGAKEQVLQLYSFLKDSMELDVYVNGNVAEIKVNPADYVGAVGFGADYAFKNRLHSVAIINPAGNYVTNFRDAILKTKKFSQNKIMNAFTGFSEIETAKVAGYLENAGINAMPSMAENGMWQIVVKPEEYFEAVNIGAKYVDGHDYRNVYWNDPTGTVMFNVADVARVARTELDEILEA